MYASATRRPQFPIDRRSEVAFLGRSNVGKSSLINSLLGGPRVARVSGTPGRTQQANFYLVDDAFFVVDLPGYGYARAPVRVRERLPEIIEAYLTGRERLAVAVMLVDSRHEPMQADLAMGAWLRAEGLPVQLVLTKIDKLPRGRWRQVQQRAAKAFGMDNAIVYSSVTGEGRKTLWQIVRRRIDRAEIAK
ncbi:MAG TPA: ribosome biogenesis GTP-binding protein YihA/YsxC [Candidatus Saccharimonadales bacterium]|nr:ribosome biogenesis GTP-binding protein YihA/YsxC [Candidatus Saccharimonadales bacterium]